MKIWTRQSPLTRPAEGTPGAERGYAGWSGPIAAPQSSLLTSLWRLARRHSFISTVCLPTLLAALYLFLIAAPIYVSEARYLVRGRQAGGLGGLGGLGGVGEVMQQAGFRAASEEATGIRDYLKSHDAIRALRQRVDLVALYRRPEADWIARLWWATPTAERLRDYYNRMTTPEYDTTSGITTLTVKSFRPGDSQEIATALLGISEELVNRLNQRVSEDALRVAREEVARAEARITGAQARVTEFRERERALDPGRAAALTVESIGKLEGALIQARAELTEAQTFARGDNQRLVQLRNRVQSLTQQLADERLRLAGANVGITQQVGEFEVLSTERELARTQLALANAALERALADAQRQQIFLLRIVEPNLAERALYPKATQNVLYLFICLSVLYGISWLLIAGTREHAA
jgi:capsular polysaccharide transport system permease protein